MANLQKTNLGVAPDGAGGDDARTAFAKFNANFDTLASQLPLTTTYIDDSTTLDASYAGKRIGVVMKVRGKTIWMPKASTVPADQTVLLWNLGAPVTIGLQGSDGSEITQLNPNDWILYVSDGNAYWHVQQRGRNGWNECVGGNLFVGGNLLASGKVDGFNNPNLLLNGSGELGAIGWTLSSPFAPLNDTSGGIGHFFSNTSAISSFANSSASAAVPINANVPMTASIDVANFATSGQVTVSFAAFNSSGTFVSNLGAYQVPNGSSLSRYSMTGTTPAGTAYVEVYVNFTGASAAAYGVVWRRVKVEIGTTASLYSEEATIAYLLGSPALSGRPTFAGKTPWDSGNFNPGNYLPLSGGVISGGLRISNLGQAVNLLADAPTGSYAGSAQGSYLGWNDSNGGGEGVLCCNKGGGAGGWVLRTVNVNNSVEMGRYTISPGGVGTSGSDRRLKKGVRTLTGSLDKIRAIRGVSYTYKATGENHYGVIAQEVQPHFPDAVTIQSAGEGKEDYLGVAYTSLVAPLIEAVKELADKYDAALSRLAKVEARQ